MTSEPTSSLIIPARRSAMFTRAFTWYTRRLLRKTFHRVMVARAPGAQPGSAATPLASLNTQRGPALALLNHSCWWDPIIGTYLHAHFTPERHCLGVMEAAQLRTFSMFRRLGIFGLEHTDPGALSAMTAYVRAEFDRDDRTLFWLTPQGEFVDVRLPVRPRPGAARLAAALNAQVLCIASELVFWADQRPEMLLRMQTCPPPPERTLRAWHRSIEACMNENARALSDLVCARDEQAFDVIISSGQKVHPLYDAWQRLRGKRTSIDLTEAQRRRAALVAPGTPRREPAR